MPTLFHRLHNRLFKRADTEHETALIRLIVGTAAGVTLLIHWSGIVERGNQTELVFGLVAFYTVAIGILAHICWRPEPTPRRRYLGIIADISFVTVTLIVGETSSTQGLVSIYLWITLANGFRFGSNYLVFALVLSTASFIGVMLTSSFWAVHAWFGFELLLGQVAVSLYARMLVAKLHRAMEREASANAAKRTFLSRMSHEMRTPLNSIVGLADLTLATQLDRNQEGMMTVLRESSLHLTSLIDDVLDFSKIEAGKFTLDITKVDLRELIWTCARIMETQAQAKCLKFDIDIDRRTPRMVYADALRLRQVLINLVGNAIKFTATGYIKISVKALPCVTNETRLEFSVQDTGIGIPADKIAKIFESFTQADESVTRTYGGTGLGVTISQNLVRLMGGTIEVDSRVGVGSIFKFILVMPIADESLEEVEGSTNMWATIGLGSEERRDFESLATPWGVSLQHHQNVDSLLEAASDISYKGAIVLGQDMESFHVAHDLRVSHSLPVVFLSPSEELLGRVPDTQCKKLKWPCNRFDLFHALHFVGNETAATASASSVSDVAYEARRRLRVLVVDDIQSNRATITAAMVAAGHSCESTESPERALDWCAESKFDLLICDRNMPGMDGVELVTEIRAQEHITGERMAIAMITGDATEHTRKVALAAGVDVFLRKPIRPKELIHAIDDLNIVPRDPAQGPTTLCPVSIEVFKDAEGPLLLDLEVIADLAALKPGDTTFVASLHASFFKDCTDWILQLDRAQTNRQIEPIKDAIHAIEGSSGSVGLMAISALCIEYHGLKTDDVDTRANEFVMRLKTLLALTKDVVKRHELISDRISDQAKD